MRKDNDLLREAKKLHLLEITRLLKWAAKCFNAGMAYPKGICLMEASVAMGEGK